MDQLVNGSNKYRDLMEPQNNQSLKQYLESLLSKQLQQICTIYNINKGGIKA